MRRAYSVCHEAWYAKINKPDLPEIMISDYPEEGGVSGEFAIRWHSLGGKNTPRLESFDDSWMFLSQCSDLINELAKLDGTDPTPETIQKTLDFLGFADITPRTAPERILEHNASPKCPNRCPMFKHRHND